MEILVVDELVQPSRGEIRLHSQRFRFAIAAAVNEVDVGVEPALDAFPESKLRAVRAGADDAGRFGALRAAERSGEVRGESRTPNTRALEPVATNQISLALVARHQRGSGVGDGNSVAEGNVSDGRDANDGWDEEKVDGCPASVILDFVSG